MNETIRFLETTVNHHGECREGYLISLRDNSSVPVVNITTIGREETNDVCLSDPYVSSKHCQIERRPHGFFIRDLKSRNGIRLNGLKVSEGQLISGTEVQIGSTDYVFKTQKPPSENNDLPMKSQNEEWMAQLINLPQLASTELPVFLQGESGTGKEVIAHILHDHSPRHDAPFISVNCGALTESLVESELFGHIKGSYTGATSDRKGAFETARGGTLFLDEIGDLPLSLQPKLLRALENQEIRPVGSDRTITTNVRIITATHKNLETLVSEGKFRSDLYFRIHVVKISIPSLRNRMEDFEDLLYFFCRQMRVRFSVAAIEELKNHRWPGNIRELKNTIARAQALYPQAQIRPEHIKNLITVPPPEHRVMPFAEAFPEYQATERGSLLKEVEKEMILARLLANKGNQRRTAADLGIPKSTLHDRIRSYDIELKSLREV